MDKEDFLTCMSVTVLLVVLFTSGFHLGKTINQISAVKHGAAHWVVSDNGSTKFEWGKP